MSPLSLLALNRLERFRAELLFINKEVSETLPGASSAANANTNANAMAMREAVTIAIGKFHDGAHKTSGTAELLQIAGGSRILRLTGFSP